jgi:DegV family protein with EDD domain
MPNRVRIVTDSSAQFIDPSVVQRYDITVVPLEIQFGPHTYREGIDIDTDDYFRRLAQSAALPGLLPPPVERFAEAYSRLSRETDQVLSIHLSRSMHSTWQNAKTATQTLLGRCEIIVLDSQTTSVGQALLVEAAAKCAETDASLDDVVRAVRKMIPRIYAVFYVESLSYLRRAGLVSESQAILGTMLGIKPFLTIEEGELITMEKVRTRSQAIDKLVEFVTEFASVDHLILLQNTPYATEHTRQLQEQLALEFSAQVVPVAMYGPSLATFIGPDAMGLFVFEGDEEDQASGASSAASDDKEGEHGSQRQADRG